MSYSSFRAAQEQPDPPDEEDWFCQGCIKKYDCNKHCKELKRFLSRKKYKEDFK